MTCLRHRYCISPTTHREDAEGNTTTTTTMPWCHRAHQHNVRAITPTPSLPLIRITQHARRRGQPSTQPRDDNDAAVTLTTVTTTSDAPPLRTPAVTSRMADWPSLHFLVANVLHCTRILLQNKLYVIFRFTDPDGGCYISMSRTINFCR
jgi:hypothetical protein